MTPGASLPGIIPPDAFSRRMPPELTPALRRSRKLWRRIRSVGAHPAAPGLSTPASPPVARQPLPVSRPATLTHRLFLKMARDRDPLLTVTSDKLAVRGFVEERLGPGYLPALYGALDSPEELLALTLPTRYVVKATHGCGMTALVRTDDRDPRGHRRSGRGMAGYPLLAEERRVGIPEHPPPAHRRGAARRRRRRGAARTGNGSASGAARPWCRSISTGSPATPGTSTIPTARRPPSGCTTRRVPTSRCRRLSRHALGGRAALPGVRLRAGGPLLARRRGSWSAS